MSNGSVSPMHIPLTYWEDSIDLDKVPSLLEYVYNLNDLSDTPSVQEYKKLKRIMKIMTRFYQKGSVSKRSQYEEACKQISRFKLEEQMIKDQIESIKPFPDSHPKKKVFLDNLATELESLQKASEPYQKKAAEYDALEKWSESIVLACQWLENTIEDYCNNNLALDHKLKIKELQDTNEMMTKHAKGLDEITFNLQESQDFFEASLDGRLRMFHQLEKCMLQAQLQAIEQPCYPSDNPRRVYIAEELRKDLEYVTEAMQEDPSKMQHKQRMRDMHRDFFRVLRWQRRKLKKLLGIEDIEPENQEELEATQKKAIVGMAACPFASKSG